LLDAVASTWVVIDSTGSAAVLIAIVGSAAPAPGTERMVSEAHASRLAKTKRS
jgi:hypothetical protein